MGFRVTNTVSITRYLKVKNSKLISMQNHFSWKRNFWGTSMHVLVREETIGTIDLNSWNYGAKGFIAGQEYIFKTRGIFSNKIDVYHSASGNLSARIKFSGWGNKAEIIYGHEKYLWKYENFWQTKWVLRWRKGAVLKSRDNNLRSSGNMIGHNTESILILISVYIKGYLDRMHSYA